MLKIIFMPALRVFLGVLVCMGLLVGVSYLIRGRVTDLALFGLWAAPTLVAAIALCVSTFSYLSNRAAYKKNSDEIRKQ